MTDFFVWSFWVQLLTALVGTVAFSVLFRVRPAHLPYAGICGALAFVLYYAVTFFGGSVFAAAFTSIFVATALSEGCARLRRAPVPVFLVPASIPIVPGGDLYYTMRYLLSGEISLCTAHLAKALFIGLGMAGGIVTASMLINFGRIALRSIKRK